MKPRHREVNIFNMSVLDLLTGALGAFCFLTLALFPSYYETQNPSAADEQLEAEQQRLQQQFGKAKKGIPPFSMWAISAGNQEGYRCGVFKIEDLQAPRGNKSFRQLPYADSEAEGYDRFAHLFIFDPASYHLTIKAYATSLPCTLSLSCLRAASGEAPAASAAPMNLAHPENLLGPGATPAEAPVRMVVPLTNSSASYLFNFEVKPEYLITSILPHR